MHCIQRSLYASAILIWTGFSALGQTVSADFRQSGNYLLFSLSNDKVVQTVVIKDSVLLEDDLSGRIGWLASYDNSDHGVRTDGGYTLEMMWTDWSAPGKTFNGDLQLELTKKDYRYTSYEFREEPGGGKILDLYFKPFDGDNTVDLKLEYELMPDKFYAKRRVGVRDTILHKDWLEKFISREGVVSDVARQDTETSSMIRAESGEQFQQVNNQAEQQMEDNRIIKKGAFGQPCAVDFAEGGVFFGIEYPAADNNISRLDTQRFQLDCSELIGTVVRQDWVNSQWVVEGLAPDHHIKDWFFNYLPDIRVAPNRPYALYNSWYDLRSPEYPGVQPDHVMNEKNILHIIDLFKQDMIDKYNIHLDAFVLDDGWDTYDGNWILRKTTFPHGMKPIADSLHLLGTTLGMWFGPTGGYSFRMRRINWMKARGYETVGSTPDDEMMDVAGPKYRALLEERTSSFDRDGVGYFKWDGIQFSSSEPGNGHPVGYHSRRAALESIIAMCDSVRAVNPNTFLNITSGTWLSPWWMKYANQIWMQGEDYGYADVPSINERDAAITYKDYVLYDDLHNEDVWFPISNMMTHGIIKGNLEKLGGDDDPLDRFADDAAMYFSRGVTMYEMYISPDLLIPREWQVLSKSLSWARDRFDILDKTYMIGGDPTLGDTYGYVHFRGDSGIVAVRNPVMKTGNITVKIDPGQGLDSRANSLVLERIYPDHWVSTDLYAAGSTITLPLDGFEAAVYELYPLRQATHPLMAGVVYDQPSVVGNNYSFDVLSSGGETRILNPWLVNQVNVNGSPVPVNQITLPQPVKDSMVTASQLRFQGNQVLTDLSLDSNDLEPRYTLFLRPDEAYKGKSFPTVQLTLDGKPVKETRQMQYGLWACYSIVLPSNGTHTIGFTLSGTARVKDWKGNAEIWLISQQKQPDVMVRIESNQSLVDKPTLPSPFHGHSVKINQELGKGELQL